MANLSVQGRNCDVETELRQHFDDKISGLERVWPKVDEAQIKVAQERGRYVAEITLISGGLVTRSEERAGNLRQAFDNAVEKIEAQLVRYKRKAQARKRRHDNRDDAGVTVLKSTMPAHTSAVETSVDVEEPHVPHPVRVKKFSLKPMSPEEASLQMDLLGHNFFVFRDADTNQVSVVYKREDGGFGLIEPVAD